MDRLIHKSPLNRIHRQLKDINIILSANERSFLQIKIIAKTIKEQVNLIDSFIQKCTSAVCSECAKVCCINRHGYYELEDLIYLYALDERLPNYKDDTFDEDPCQFLSHKGCNTPRYKRPFRCNWYFCIPLINYMQAQRGKEYRRFQYHMGNIIDYRKQLIDLYRNILTYDRNF